MAIDKKTLQTRSLTAAVFALLMLAGLFINGWSFLLLFTIIHFGCWVEFVRIIRKIYGNKFLPYTIIGMFYITVPILAMLDLGISMNFYPDHELAGHPHFLLPAAVNYSPLLPIAVILSIWVNDTMAYIVGSMIGKTPFSKISPKKTWEGTAGGVILCIIVMGLIGYFVPIAKTIPLIHWFAIAAIAGITGTMGDLFESKLKRMAGLKDSGNFMPGHGGFLDRFDSLLIATPLVWLYVKLFLI